MIGVEEAVAKKTMGTRIAEIFSAVCGDIEVGILSMSKRSFLPSLLLRFDCRDALGEGSFQRSRWKGALSVGLLSDSDLLQRWFRYGNFKAFACTLALLLQ